MTAKSINPAPRSRAKPTAAKPHVARKPRPVRTSAWGADLLKKIDALRQALAAKA